MRGYINILWWMLVTEKKLGFCLKIIRNKSLKSVYAFESLS